VSLLDRHVDLFNQAIRTGDFAPMLEQFTEDAELVFEGVPVGPFVGKQAIADAYAANPPDDEVEILSFEESPDPIVATTPGGRRGPRGRPHDRHAAGDEIAKLVVTFD
jgi:hypothetical protein